MAMKESCVIKMLDETTVDETDSGLEEYHVFILVNSKSGSEHGSELIRKFHRGITFTQSDNQMTQFYIYDLYNLFQRDTCFTKVNNLTDKDKNVRILIGGGDGTVQWVISESISHEINFDKVVFGVLPIGTGNDFAASIGWDQEKLSVTEKGLRELANRLKNCYITKYDVWECQVDTYESGSITEIKNGQETIINSKSIKKSFTNYCGIGSDAQVSYLSQKINASSIFLKKLVYGIAGFWSLFRCASKLAKKVIQFYHVSELITTKTEENELSNKSIESNCVENNEISDLSFLPTDSCLTFLNSTSSMEIKNIWGTPHVINPQMEFKEQKVNDGIIEIVSYRNEFSLGLERFMHMAKKVGQGEGPFTLTFKEPEANKKESTYIHINGEPYKIEGIESVTISKNQEIPESCIKILKFNK